MPPELPLDLRQAGDSEPGCEPWHVASAARRPRLTGVRSCHVTVSVGVQAATTDTRGTGQGLRTSLACAYHAATGCPLGARLRTPVHLRALTDGDLCGWPSPNTMLLPGVVRGGADDEL